MDTMPPDTAAPPPDGFLPLPEAGRVFTGDYPIRRTDVTPGGRLRFDALARYLQDVAEDDIAEAGLREPYDWLVRRCTITVRGYPQRGQRLRLTTFCSATGPRWAERTTTLSASGTELIQARAVWAAVTRDHRGVLRGGTGLSPASTGPPPRGAGHPRACPIRGRTRRHRPGTGRCGPAISTPPGTSATPFTGRRRRRCSPGSTGWPARAEMEYHHPILPGDRLRLAYRLTPGRADIWLLNDARRLASAQLSPDPGEPGADGGPANGSHG